jgi:hypothetical protein
MLDLVFENIHAIVIVHIAQVTVIDVAMLSLSNDAFLLGSFR